MFFEEEIKQYAGLWDSWCTPSKISEPSPTPEMEFN